MRMIFEHVEGVDYLEFILTPKEILKLKRSTYELKGPVKTFPENTLREFKLNVFIRPELEEKIIQDEEEADAAKKRNKQEDHFYEYKRNDRSRSPTKASRRGRHDIGSQIGSQIT